MLGDPKRLLISALRWGQTFFFRTWTRLSNVLPSFLPSLLFFAPDISLPTPPTTAPAPQLLAAFAPLDTTLGRHSKIVLLVGTYPFSPCSGLGGFFGAVHVAHFPTSHIKAAARSRYTAQHSTAQHGTAQHSTGLSSIVLGHDRERSKSMSSRPTLTPKSLTNDFSQSARNDTAMASEICKLSSMFFA